MNKERRERLYDVSSMIEDTISELEDIISEETDAFDDLSPGLQSIREDQYTNDTLALEHFIDDLQSINSQIVDMADNKKKR